MCAILFKLTYKTIYPTFAIPVSMNNNQYFTMGKISINLWHLVLNVN